jgi:hypothetical protein
MDLMSKAILAAVILVIVIFVGYYAISHVSFGKQLTEAQASSLVFHDLQNSNPSAIINITNVTASRYPGSWHIIASIVTNATSPCPSYSIYSIDYPAFTFVNGVENTYTGNCTIYGRVPGTNYSIGSYPVAITDSYIKNISIVKVFVDRYGFSNVVVHATYYNSTNYNGENYTGVWLVEYTTPNSNQTISVLLSQQSGAVLSSSGSV